ncbi:MAG: EAL domain-containing protein [Pseudomonadota bacterium]
MMLLASTSTPMALVDGGERILWVNDAFGQFYGQNIQTLSGHVLGSIRPLSGDRPMPGAENAASFLPCDGEDFCAPFCGRMTRLRCKPLGDGSRLVEFNDLGELTNLRQQIEHSRQRDELTGLRNRHSLAAILREIHAHGQAYATLLIDIDRFKIINDFHGHDQGDETLIRLGGYIQEIQGPDDIIGRWSGHEFLCLLPGRTLAQAREHAETIRQHVRNSFESAPARQPQTITVSIGVATRGADDTNHEAVIARADAALYEAKRRGRNRTVTQGDIGQSIFIASAEIEAALHEERLIPAYQPIVELATRRVVADEALARIRGRDGGMLPAGLFIEAASALQIAHRIDHSIVCQAIRRCSNAIVTHPDEPPIRHFVNISTDLLRHPRRIEAILQVAREAAIECGMQCALDKPLVIEITERELLSDPREALDILRPFLDFGLQIAVDDFGSGYSSFLYLLDLPVTYLKIEGELVRRIRQDPKARAIIQGIQSIADQLDLMTIAEFIEDEETARILTDLGVDWGQGYLFGRPVIDETGRGLRAQNTPHILRPSSTQDPHQP